MVCTACKYEFCWLCEKKYTETHYRYDPRNPCGGRMFTDYNVSKCSLCCSTCCRLINFIFFPLYLILFVLFILPIYYFLTEFNRIRTRTIQINRMQPHDNRFLERDYKATYEKIGCWRLLGYTLLSILLSPVIFVFLALPIVILLLMWLFAFFFVIYSSFRMMCFICRGSSGRPAPENPRRNEPVLREANLGR